MNMTVRGLAAVDAIDKIPMPVLARSIIRNAARAHNVPAIDVLKGSMHPPAVRARQDAMVDLVNRSTWTLARIGRLFGRDHTTVMHAINRLPQPMMTDHAMRVAYHLVATYDAMRDGVARTPQQIGAIVACAGDNVYDAGRLSVARLRRRAQREGLRLEISGETPPRSGKPRTYRLCRVTASPPKDSTNA